MDNVINLLANDNYIIVNKSLIKSLGLNEAILIGELASEYNFYKKSNMLDADGFFYSTVDNVKENTGLCKDAQLKAIRNLSERGLLISKLKGMPAKRYIKFCCRNIASLLEETQPTSWRKSRQLVGGNTDTNNNNNNNKKNNNNNNVPNWLNKDLDVSQLTTDEIKEMQALFDTILIN